MMSYTITMSSFPNFAPHLQYSIRMERIKYLTMPADMALDISKLSPKTKRMFGPQEKKRGIGKTGAFHLSLIALLVSYGASNILAGAWLIFLGNNLPRAKTVPTVSPN